MKFVKLLFAFFIISANLFSNNFSIKITSTKNYQFEFNQFKQKVILMLQTKLNRDLSLKNVLIKDNFTKTKIDNLITFDKNKKMFNIDLDKLNTILQKEFNSRLNMINEEEYIENNLERMINNIRDIDKLLIPINFDNSQKIVLKAKIEQLKLQIGRIRFSPAKSINIINNVPSNIPIMLVSFAGNPMKNLYFLINGKKYSTNSNGEIFLKNIANFRSINLLFDEVKTFQLNNVENKSFFRNLISKNINFKKQQIQINRYSPPLIQNLDHFFDENLMKIGYKISRQKTAILFKTHYMTISSGKSQIQGYFAKIKGDAYIIKNKNILKHYEAVGTGLSLISTKDAKKIAKLEVKEKLKKLLKK